MSLLSQSTIARKISFSGIGVHTGKKVNVNILPATPNSGIIFKRSDLIKNNIVVPNFQNVCEATLCTTVSNQFGVKISTIEHLMAAFIGLGVDNAIVEIDHLPGRDYVKDTRRVLVLRILSVEEIQGLEYSTREEMAEKFRMLEAEDEDDY